MPSLYTLPIGKVRKVILEQHARITGQIESQRKEGQKDSDVLLDDPFLAGQAYVFGLIACDLAPDKFWEGIEGENNGNDSKRP